MQGWRALAGIRPPPDRESRPLHAQRQGDVAVTGVAGPCHADAAAGRGQRQEGEHQPGRRSRRRHHPRRVDLEPVLLAVMFRDPRPAAQAGPAPRYSPAYPRRAPWPPRPSRVAARRSRAVRFPDGSPNARPRPTHWPRASYPSRQRTESWQGLAGNERLWLQASKSLMIAWAGVSPSYIYRKSYRPEARLASYPKSRALWRRTALAATVALAPLCRRSRGACARHPATVQRHRGRARPQDHVHADLDRGRAKA